MKKIASFSIIVLILLSVTINCFATSTTIFISSYPLSFETYTIYDSSGNSLSSYGYLDGIHKTTTMSPPYYTYRKDGNFGILSQTSSSFNNQFTQYLNDGTGRYIVYKNYTVYYSGTIYTNITYNIPS